MFLYFVCGFNYLELHDDDDVDSCSRRSYDGTEGENDNDGGGGDCSKSDCVHVRSRHALVEPSMCSLAFRTETVTRAIASFI